MIGRSSQANKKQPSVYKDAGESLPTKFEIANIFLLIPKTLQAKAQVSRDSRIRLLPTRKEKKNFFSLPA